MTETETSDTSENRQNSHGLSSGFLVFLFVVLALAISGMGIFFYTYERDQFQHAARDRLIAIAHWQLREIQNWRTERVRDAIQFTTSPYNAWRIARLLNSSPHDDPGNDLLAFLNEIKEKSLYHDLLLTDVGGNVRLSTNRTLRRLSSDEGADLNAAVRSKGIFVADIRRGESADVLHLNVYAPIWEPRTLSDDSVIVGVLILELNPETFLFPLIETWPTLSKTGETILVRREGDDVVFISKLRFRNYSPLTLRLPMSENEKVAAVMAGRGVTGVVKAVDYRDAEVLSALYRIPDSPWYLVAKIDEAEVAGPLRMVITLILGIVTGLMLFLSAAMLLWWKRTEAKYLRTEYEAEKEKRFLLERVAAERERAEEQLRLHNEQLEKIVQDRTEKIRRLERERLEDEKQVALGRMAARVAHEINNPLAGIKNAFTLVKRAIPAEHRHYEFVELIDRELDRIARIVRQMFELYRQYREKISVIHPTNVINDVALLLAGNAEARQVTLEVAAEGAPQPVLLNEDSLRQVLFALVQNAIEASPPGGRVRLASRVQDNNLIVAVTDEGQGIPEEYRSRIFEPFFTTKEGLTTGGLGLGLSVSRGLVENLGGGLTFDCVPGQGTTFTVVFPVRIPTAENIHG